MKQPERVVENLAKVFLNLGQGIILAALLARLIQHQATFTDAIIAPLFGMTNIAIGRYLISEYAKGMD